MAEGLTLYKLMILFMLRKVSFPLTNSQITEFMTDRGYTDYFHVQQALSDLTDSKLITAEKIRNMSQYTTTDEGEKTLEYFSNEISFAIKRDIRHYLKEHSFELRSESCMPADWVQTGDGGYEVNCRVSEGPETLLAITLNVATEEEAEKICVEWPARAQEIYLDLMTRLL